MFQIEREGLSNPSVNIGAEEDPFIIGGIDTLTHLEEKIIAEWFKFQTNNFRDVISPGILCSLKRGCRCWSDSITRPSHAQITAQSSHALEQCLM